MSNPAFKMKEAFGAGWNGFKKNIFLFIILLLISMFASLLSAIIFGILPVALSSILSLAVGSYFMMAILKAALQSIDGKKPGWDVLKTDLNHYLKFFAVTLIFSICISISAAFLIIPMFFVMALLFPVQYMMIDNPNASIIGVFKRSANITSQFYGNSLLFIVLCVLLIIAGIIALILGLFIAVPVVYVAMAAAYRMLNSAAGKEVEAETEEVKVAPEEAMATSGDTVGADIIR